MASHAKILNLTNGFSYRRTRAERAIRECSAEWVVRGVSIRSLTIAESIAARNKESRLREPLPLAEICGLVFSPPVSGIHATRREGRLMWAAHDFVQSGGRMLA
jgi:hypothetical protein